MPDSLRGVRWHEKAYPVGYNSVHAEERALLGNKTGATRLGFAVLLKYFQRAGRFPQYKNEVPRIVITYLATQVDVDAAAYLQYDWQGRMIEYHRAQIRTALGFREASLADGEAMSQWLAEHVLPHEHQEDMVRQSCYQHFRLQHLEPPKPDRVTRIIRSAYHIFETRLYETAVGSLDERARAALDALLVEAPTPDEGQAEDWEPVTLCTRFGWTQVRWESKRCSRRWQNSSKFVRWACPKTSLATSPQKCSAPIGNGRVRKHPATCVLTRTPSVTPYWLRSAGSGIRRLLIA